MSGADPGLAAAVQRVKRIASMSAYIVEDSLIERVVRAAREEEPVESSGPPPTPSTAARGETVKRR